MGYHPFGTKPFSPSALSNPSFQVIKREILKKLDVFHNNGIY